MKIIQPLLIGGFLLVLGIYAVYLRTTLRDRLLASFFVVLAVLAVLFPDLTTVAAHRLGVGRGTDLLLYLLAIGGTFVFLLIYIRLLRLEQAVTTLVRSLAILESERRPEARQPEPPAGA